MTGSGPSDLYGSASQLLYAIGYGNALLMIVDLNGNTDRLGNAGDDHSIRPGAESFRDGNAADISAAKGKRMD